MRFGLQVVNTLALKWRRRKGCEGQVLKTKCNEPPPPAPETWQAKSGCSLPAYHRGRHQSHKFTWAPGARGVQRRRQCS